MRKEGIIRIELKSDLCVASGYSYAGLVDSDICYDDCGIPYIPARRLKGCFKETAESILYSLLNENDCKLLFGCWGDNGTKGICFENAHIQNYDKIREEIARCIRVGALNKEDVFSSYTNIQAQTKLNDGVADDKSLRFTRVVNRMSLFNNKNMIFEAKVRFEDDENASVETKLHAVVGATKSIGLKRNRGNGAVSCCLQDIHPVNALDFSSVESEGEEEVRLDFIIKNIEPLMISGINDSASVNFIPGQNILGFLANEYLKMENKDASDKAFSDLFLNGNTIYTNLYPCVDGKIFYPAPEYINRLKKSKKIVNSLFDLSKESEKDPSFNTNQNGQPKKLKGVFTTIEQENEVSLYEVGMKSVYHHSKKGDEILYKLDAIAEGQFFSGSIYVKEKYKGIVKELLVNSNISFGKSKSAEYGKCELVGKICENENKDSFNAKAGDVIVVNMLSDGIFMGKNDYSTDRNDVRSRIAEDLGINVETTSEKDLDIIQVTQVIGFQSMWRLHKNPVPAIKAGSCYTFTLNKDVEIKKNFVGEKNHEGYGMISIKRFSEMTPGIEKKDVWELKLQTEEVKLQTEEVKLLLKNAYKNLICTYQIQERLSGEPADSGFTKSKIGRITLMMNEAYNNCKLIKESFVRDLIKRIHSIKDKKVSELAEKKITKVIDEVDAQIEASGDKDNYLYAIKKMLSILDNNGESIEILSQNDKDELYYNVLKAWLTYEKYMAKVE